jgi:hypothetical protein
MNLQSSRCNGHIKLTGITGLEARTPNQRAFSGVPEAVKPRDIAISAASETGVKLTSNESISRSQFANSIGISDMNRINFELSVCLKSAQNSTNPPYRLSNILYMDN